MRFPRLNKLQHAEVDWNWGPLPITRIKAPRLIQPKANKKTESFPEFSHLSCRPSLSASPGRTHHPRAPCLCPRCQRTPSSASAAGCPCVSEMRFQTQHNDKQSSLSCNPLCVCPLLRAPSGVVSTLVSVRQRLTNPMISLSLSLSLSSFLSLGIGSASLAFLPSFFPPPPPLCVSFKVNGACGRRSLGLSRALWECGVTWPCTQGGHFG